MHEDVLTRKWKLGDGGVDHLSGIHGDFMGERLQVKMVSITGDVYGDRSKSMHMVHADIPV